MELVYFQATVLDDSLGATHAEMVRQMRELAESIDGFVEWRDSQDGMEYWGHVIFATPEASAAWKGSPRHAEIHQQGECQVYAGFTTQVFSLIRQAEWQRAPSG